MRETSSSAKKPERTKVGTKMRQAAPKSTEDDQRLSGKTEGADGKGDHLSDGGESLPGRPTVSETKSKSTNVKMKTSNKEENVKVNPARSTLGGPQSVHGDCKNLHRPKPRVKDKEGSDHQEEGSFRGGKDVSEAMFKNEEDGREILPKEIKNKENSRGRRPGGGKIMHGDHNNLEVGNKEEKQNRFRGGIEALEDHAGSMMGNVDNLAKEAKNTGKSRGSTPGDNKTPRRSNRSAVDEAGRRQEEVNSFRGGTKAVAVESESKEEDTKTFTNNTNITEEGPEVFPEVLRSARSRDFTCKGTTPRCPRPVKNDEICTSGRADHPPRPAHPILLPAHPPWTRNKTVFLVLLIFVHFTIAASAAPLPDRSAGHRWYEFCVGSTNLTGDHLMFREVDDTMHIVCEFKSGNMLPRTNSNYTAFLHNETCAHMETTDPKPVNYTMEYSDGKSCRSVPLDSSKVSENNLKINQSSNETLVTGDTSLPWIIIIPSIVVPTGLALLGWGIYRRWKKRTYKSVSTDINLRNITVDRNGLQPTSEDEDASRNGNANGVQTSYV